MELWAWTMNRGRDSEGQADVDQLSSSVCTRSFLDILYLGRIFPKRAVIMAKKELRWAPLLGQYRQSASPYLSQRLPMPLRHGANRFNNDFAFLLDFSPMLFHFDDPQPTVTLSGAVMVDRKNSKDAVKMMHHVGEDMKRKGVSLWIFPEGTRSLRKEDELLPFKKGAFHLAVQGEFRCQSRVRGQGLPAHRARYVGFEGKPELT